MDMPNSMSLAHVSYEKRGFSMNGGVVEQAPSDSQVVLYAQAGKLESLRQVIIRGLCDVNTIDSMGRSALLCACINDDEPMTHFLLSQKADYKFVQNMFKSDLGLGFFMAKNRCFALVDEHAKLKEESIRLESSLSETGLKVTGKKVKL